MEIQYEDFIALQEKMKAFKALKPSNGKVLYVISSSKSKIRLRIIIFYHDKRIL